MEDAKSNYKYNYLVFFLSNINILILETLFSLIFINSKNETSPEQ